MKKLIISISIILILISCIARHTIYATNKTYYIANVKVDKIQQYKFDTLFYSNKSKIVYIVLDNLKDDSKYIIDLDINKNEINKYNKEFKSCKFILFSDNKNRLLRMMEINKNKVTMNYDNIFINGERVNNINVINGKVLISGVNRVLDKIKLKY